MPYKKTKDGSLVNEVTLGDGYPLSNDLQPLKVGGEASPIEMSTSLPDDSDNAKVKVRGDLEVTGGLNFKNDVEVDLSFDDLSLSGDLDVAGDVTVDTDTLKVDATNNRVGIGTTSPLTPLHIESSVNALSDTDDPENCHLLLRNPANDTDEGVGLGFLISAGTGDIGASVVYKRTGSAAKGELRFNVKTNTDSEGVITQAMTIADDAKVGIGTTSPTAPLDIAGDTLVDSSGTDTLLNLSQTLNSPSGDNSGVATETYSMIKGNVTNTDSAGWDNKFLLQLQTGGTDKLKSDLSGNVTSAGTVTSSAGVCQGPQKYIFQASARAYTKNDYWYWPNGTYGINYYQWNNTGSSSSLGGSYYDAWNPSLIVPVDMVINEYYYYGNTSGRDNTFELALRHGTGVAWDDTHNDHFSMSTVGATQSGDWTANSYNKIGQTGLSVSVSAGDAIIPHHRRTTNNDSTTEYMEIVFVVVCTIS